MNFYINTLFIPNVLSSEWVKLELALQRQYECVIGQFATTLPFRLRWLGHACMHASCHVPIKVGKSCVFDATCIASYLAKTIVRGVLIALFLLDSKQGL